MPQVGTNYVPEKFPIVLNLTCRVTTTEGSETMAQINAQANAWGPDIEMDDPYYSNQGVEGVCVCHVLAKAIRKEISQMTNNGVVIRVNNIVTMLLNQTPKACPPTVIDWNGCSGTVQDITGNIFQLKVQVIETDFRKPEDYGKYQIITCNVNQVFPERNSPVGSHAMFCEAAVDRRKRGVHLRNSWGHLHEKAYLRLDTTHVISSYQVVVTELIQKHYTSGTVVNQT